MKDRLASVMVGGVALFCCALTGYGEGRIERSDVFIIAENWQTMGGGPGDFTGDGMVDEADILYVIEHWKQPTSPTVTPTETPTATSTPTDTLVPTPSWTPTPTATATPTATSTPTWPAPTTLSNEIIIDIRNRPVKYILGKAGGWSGRGASRHGSLSG